MGLGDTVKSNFGKSLSGLNRNSKRETRRGEQVWMEELEGRVLLSRAEWLDLSHVQRRSGEGSASFKFEAKAGERYLFLQFQEYGFMHLSDSDGRELVWVDETDDVSRLSWRAPKAGTYTIHVETFDDWLVEYDFIARVADDDFGNNRENATPLGEGQVITGEIEDVIDRDVFS